MEMRTLRELGFGNLDLGEKAQCQRELEPHESFDDYLEMITQFGYIVLFPSAFPMAAPFALMSNVIEILSDAFRLTFLDQRPRPHRQIGIGAWMQTLKITSVTAIFSNCFIFVLCSEQMPLWFPSLFECDEGEEECNH